MNYLHRIFHSKCFEVNFSVSSGRRNQGLNMKLDKLEFILRHETNLKEKSTRLSFEFCVTSYLVLQRVMEYFWFGLVPKSEWWDVGCFRTLIAFFSFYPFLLFPHNCSLGLLTEATIKSKSSWSNGWQKLPSSKVFNTRSECRVKKNIRRYLRPLEDHEFLGNGEQENCATSMI